MMSYDLHGTWDSTNKWIGPIVQAHTNLTEIDNALELLWRNDIDPKQVTLGLGFYGRSEWTYSSIYVAMEIDDYRFYVKRSRML